MEERVHNVIISLASNEGQRQNMQAARELLGALLSDVRYTKEIWTEPVGTHRKAPYLNQLCQGTTHAGADLLGSQLNAMERRLGRTRNEEGIVTIDLDLLQYDDRRMHLRDWGRNYVRQLIDEL